MEWHFNDLSLRGQFKTGDDVKQAFAGLIALRFRRPDLKDRFYCSQGLFTRPATPTRNLHEAIHDTHDRNFIELATRWLGNSGPFWNATRQHSDDDLFYWREEDVTDQGLGEVSRRQLAAIEASTFSLVQPQDDFDVETLQITQGLLEGPVGSLVVPNSRSLRELEETRTVPLTGWDSLLVLASACEHIQLSAELILPNLRPRPYHQGIAERLLELIVVLDRISAETDANSELSEAGQKLVQLHFVGKKAQFSSEEPLDKHVFWFSDPAGGGDIYCDWHGKIRFGGQYRMHFEWPRPKGQTRLKICYIGEKLTKQ